MPSRIVLECRPPRLAICKRFPWEYVGQLITGFPDESRPEANGMDAVSFPDGKKLVSKAGQQFRHLPRNRLIHTQLVNHRQHLHAKEAGVYPLDDLRP